MNKPLHLVCMIALIVILALLPLILFFVLKLHFKKKSAVRKVQGMSPHEKQQLINTLLEPLGYLYDPEQDIFSTRQGAPQKEFGYMHLYDLTAPYFNMIYDYETIYFDYNNRTWLIEFWKGQYGINSGCELGIYYADGIVSPLDYSTVPFHGVDGNDMLNVSLWLNKDARMKGRHWWLTIFQMGVFAHPADLIVNASIHFKNYHMMSRFLDSFRDTLPDTPYRVNGTTVYFTFHQSSRRYSVFRRMVRSLALASCRLYCRLFQRITKPFSNSGDKLLYLYYYLPCAVHCLLKQKKPKKSCCLCRKWKQRRKTCCRCRQSEDCGRCRQSENCDRCRQSENCDRCRQSETCDRCRQSENCDRCRRSENCNRCRQSDACHCCPEPPTCSSSCGACRENPK